MRCLSWFLASVLAVSAPCLAQAETPTCAPVTDTEVAGFFDLWNAALATGDAEIVAARYAEDGILLATTADEPRIGTEAIRDYFEDFLRREPSGSIISRTIVQSCNVAYDVGVYVFTLRGNRPGSTAEIPARYTYVYEFEDGRWRIAHHSSSAMPTPVWRVAAVRPQLR